MSAALVEHCDWAHAARFNAEQVPPLVLAGLPDAVAAELEFALFEPRGEFVLFEPRGKGVLGGGALVGAEHLPSAVSEVITDLPLHAENIHPPGAS